MANSKEVIYPNPSFLFTTSVLAADLTLGWLGGQRFAENWNIADSVPIIGSGLIVSSVMAGRGFKLGKYISNFCTRLPKTAVEKISAEHGGIIKIISGPTEALSLGVIAISEFTAGFLGGVALEKEMGSGIILPILLSCFGGYVLDSRLNMLSGVTQRLNLTYNMTKDQQTDKLYKPFAPDSV